MINDLLDIAWPAGVPKRLASVVDRSLCASLLSDFKLGLILSWATPPSQTKTKAATPARALPTRMAYSDQGEAARWQREVLHHWPSEEAARFLEPLGAGPRRMVDSDGSRTAVLYLDDLQNAAHPLVVPAQLRDLELMCATFAPATGERGWLTRHLEPPLDKLHGGLLDRTRALLDLGAEGLWALRWSGSDVASVLWITESRWRRNPDASNAVVSSLLEQTLAPTVTIDTLADLQASLSPHRHLLYPDALELIPRGVADLTIGFL
jgi:hypothetical protein